MKNWISIVLYLIVINGYSQNKTIALLEHKIQNESSEEVKGNLYYELAEIYRKNSKVDSAYLFAKQGYLLVKDKKNDSLKIIAALQLFRISSKIIEKDTVNYLEIASTIAQKYPKKTLQIELYYAQGLAAFFDNELATSLPLFLKIDSLSKKYNINNKTTIDAIIRRSEISRLKFTEKNTAISEKLLLEALQIAQKIKSEEMIHLIYSYLADVYQLMGKLEEAKKYIDLAFRYYQTKEDNIRNISQLYLLSTAYYLELNDLEKAKNEQLKRLNYLRSQDDQLELARALMYYGSFQRRKTKEYKEAINNLLEAKQIYESLNLTGIDPYERLIYSLAICYSKMENYKKSSGYYELAYDLREDGMRKENRLQTSALETKYQTEKKEQKIALLSAQNQIEKKQKYIYFAIALLITTLAIFLLLYYKNKIKTAQKIKELNELKSRFFANISHEFRTPLTLIKSPVQSLQKEINQEKQLEKLHLIEKNSDRMLELVNQLLELSKIDSGNLKLILKEEHITATLQAIIESFDFQAKEKDKKFLYTFPNETETYFLDKDVLEKIVTNLLSNAFKYTNNPEEIIQFESKIETNFLKMTVTNAVSGIKTEDIPKLFDRFYQTATSKHGTGIGLALVKELVALYDGKIETKLENNNLSFLVWIPLDKTNTHSLKITPSDLKETNSSEEIEAKTNSEKPIVLIVDDNKGIRNVLKSLLEEKYRIIEAENGIDAVQLAQKEIPDCIISDVMMPKIDGFEFTKNIKSNELTSHIPVILLTAKVTEISHIEALKNNADAFLTKPFHNEVIIETVLQLINERKKLQERYSQELVLKPTKIVVDSFDEKFITRLETILDKNVSNPDFTAEDFANEANLSRMQLHRKLKSLFGVSATEFIRNERLKMAHDLLKNSSATVSEIAYAVGFNEVTYFSKCFKDLYTISPSECQKSK
ncbi:response regulator [Flavobacterium sp. J27]|uniref:response regulator n=1 Tax=Flavobacterium sp. J27 TaxID=2060419 RepID=UPI0010323A5B|nr:response regulator [Flavobacterium sp. J27]